MQTSDLPCRHFIDRVKYFELNGQEDKEHNVAEFGLCMVRLNGCLRLTTCRHVLLALV